jgi:hypothetical protein
VNSKRLDLTRRTIRALLVLPCAWLLAAVPAQAGNDFGDAFERQLGRLAAVEVFHVGHEVLYNLHPQHYGSHTVSHYPVRQWHGHQGLHRGYSGHHCKSHNRHHAGYGRSSGKGSRHHADRGGRRDRRDRHDRDDRRDSHHY